MSVFCLVSWYLSAPKHPFELKNEQNQYKNRRETVFYTQQHQPDNTKRVQSNMILLKDFKDSNTLNARYPT